MTGKWVEHIKNLNSLQSFRLTKLMEKLQQAKQLSAKADSFLSEGNEEYAIRCYQKIVLLLKQALSQATSKESIEAIKQKIAKYIEKKAEASYRQSEKEAKRMKITKLGFPKQGNHTIDVGSLKKNADLMGLKVQQNLPKKFSANDNRKPLFEKQRKKVQLDPAMEELIIKKLDVSFKDIVGLKQVKTILEEAVIRPRQRPDLYTGIRAPPKGILLYGPPGNGKTFICKALAKQSNCTFFSLSASSIMNKLVGESEKMIKKVFWAAEQMAPSIIFIDQIDSMLTARSQHENDASRRLKTEFLVLMDGMSSPKSGDVLVIGATNLPRQLDNAAKRRFSKMIFIGHPDAEARKEMIIRNLKDVQYELSASDLKKLVDKLEYFSASEIRSIIAEACMIPLREVERSKFEKISPSELRKVSLKDFVVAMGDRKPIVSKEELLKYRQI